MFLPTPSAQFDTLIPEAYGGIAASATGFVIGATFVYVVGRLLVVPAARRAVRSRNRNNPTIASATETYAHAMVVFLAAVGGVVGAGYGAALTNGALIIAALTLVVGVAGQAVIGALIGGLFLVADPDFNVGDYVAWPGGEGVVEAIDFRVTRIRTPDNETIAVPNTELTTNALRRPYGRERYRVTERVDVAHDDVEQALYEARAVAGEDDRVLAEPMPTTRVIEVGTGSVGIRAEFWVEDPIDVELVDVRSSFRRRVTTRFAEEGLTLSPAAGREVSGALTVERDAATPAGGGS
jgi:small-conductance mechanosensitive channel